MKDELFARFIAYMNLVIYRARIDYLRKTKRTSENEVMFGKMPDMPCFDDLERRCTSLNQLSSHPKASWTLSTLKGNDQKVMYLLFCQQYSVKEVAKAMDLSQSSIYRIRDRVLERLRNDMCGGDTNA